MGLTGDQIELLTPLSDSASFSHLSVSPDGRRLAMSCWTAGGYWDIYLYDVQSGEFRPLMVDQWQDLWPCWSDDGQKIWFSSDRSGIWNIWEYDLSSRAMTNKTNAVGGAFEPVYLCGDSVLFLNLSSKGYDLAKTPLSGHYPVCQRDQHAETGGGDSGYQMTDRQVKDYKPIRSMLPVLWFPTAVADEKSAYLGAVFWGWDDLMLNSYMMSMVPAIDNDRLYYSLYYTDNSRWLGCSLVASNMPYPFRVTVDGHDTTFWQREQEQKITLTLPFTRTVFQLRTYLSYSHVRLSPLNFNGEPRPFWDGDLGEITMGILYSDTRQHGYSISPEGGRKVMAEASFYRKCLGSDVSQSVLLMQWSEYLALPLAHQVMMLQPRMGIYQYDGIGIFDKTDLFDLRGESQQDTWGRRRVAATAEYRFPIWRVQKGRSTWPIFFDNLSGSVFYEAGSAAQDWRSLREMNPAQSAGLELNNDWRVFYALPLRITLGIAKNITPQNGTSYYLAFGQGQP
jgi:hypothetical protein